MIAEKYFEHFPQLETERLLLRKLELSDAKDIQQIRSHPEVMHFMDSRPHASEEDSKKFIQENFEIFENKKGLFWALEEKKSGNFLGDLAYWKIDSKNSRGEIGYTLKPDYWGKGFMKEAMISLLKFGFRDLQLHSVEANINPKNENSRKLLLSLGFRKEAYFRENYFFDGKFLDTELYSLLESDFKLKFPN